MLYSLCVVVPCFNEAEGIARTVRTLSDELLKCQERSLLGPVEILFVDDGSTDDTVEAIVKASADLSHGKGLGHIRVSILRLHRNVGHQTALYAGLLEATGDFVVSIDADLQDPVSALVEMIELVSKARGRVDIVLGVREDRQSDTGFKRWTADLFYRLMGWLGTPLQPQHADFRMMSKKAIRLLSRFREADPFLRGIVPTLGLKTEIVKYRRQPREFGTSKYPFWKMVRLAWNGILGFSAFPLRVISAVGMITAMMSLIVAVWTFAIFLSGSAIPGWTSIVLPMMILTSVQLLAMGVMGEYVARIFSASLGRPRYHGDLFHVAPHDSSLRLTRSVLDDRGEVNPGLEGK